MILSMTGFGKASLHMVKLVSAILIFVGVYLVIHKKKEAIISSEH
jgi:hypothetical protein